MVGWKRTTNASLTRLPLGSLDLKTQVSNTGTATPQRIYKAHRATKRSAELARKRARYAQRTERQRLSSQNTYTEYTVVHWVPSHELRKYTSRSYTVFHNYVCSIDFHALMMNNFENRVLRIEPTAV